MRISPFHTYRARCGFTLVEVLVVMGIIALLLALLLPAIGGARKRGFKTRELNDIKNLGHAWMMYGNSNNDAALPGFLEPAVQQERVMGVSRGWGVEYHYPDGSSIPIDSTNLAGPWTWRLLAYLSYNHGLIHSHLEESDDSPFALVAEGKAVAYEPAFGYNALYLGGWWSMQDVGGVQTPMFRFFDNCAVGGHKRQLSVPLSISQVNRPSDMTVFCASSQFGKTGLFRNLPSTTPGFHMVTPPTVATTQHWQADKSNAAAVDVLKAGAFAPLTRYTNTIAFVAADGHVDQQGYSYFQDMRKWVNSAEAFEFEHAPCGSNE